MFSQLFQDRGLGVKRLLAIVAIVVLLVGGLSAAGLSGVALAQSDESGSTGGVSVTASDGDSDSDADEEDDGGDGPDPASDQAAAEDAREEMMEDGSSSGGGVGGNAGGAPSEQTQADQAEAEEAREGMQEDNTTADGGVGGNAGGEPSEQVQQDQATAEESREGMVGDDPSGGVGYGAQDDDDGVGFVAQRMLDMISGLTTQAQNEFGELLSMMLEYATTRSAPGIADQPDTWDEPEDAKWQGSIDVMGVTRLMGMLFGSMMVLYALGTYGLNARGSKQKLITAIPVAIFLIRPEVWIGLSLHGSNTISTTISPSPEMLATPESILAVSLSVIAAGLLAASSLWIIVLATLVTVISHEAGLATTAFLPLAASFFLGPMYLRSIGEMVVYLHGVTIIMPIFQALGTLAVVQMFFSGGGALTSLSGVLALLGTIYLLYYLFQKEVLEKAFDAPIVSLGVDGARMGIDGAKNAANAPQAMRDIRSSIENGISGARSKFTGSDGGSGGSDGSGWRPDIGAVQSPSLSSGGRRSGPAVADGGSDGGSQPDAKSWGSRPVGRDSRGRFQSIDSMDTTRERERLSSGDY